VFYNAAEGIVSVVFGVDSSSHSLVFFGIQSVIEVISSALVLWRFLSVAKPGDEDNGNDTTALKTIRQVGALPRQYIGD
jgi:predicted Co/Zn/Cd cation transporter (cation efflux family)